MAGTTTEGYDMPDITNHPVKNDIVDRVFVGIPDVFAPDQLARLHGLMTAEKIGVRFNLKGGDEDAVGEMIKAADRFAVFILGDTEVAS